MVITSKVRPTHRQRTTPLEAWLFTGQSFDKWPDWLRSHYINRKIEPAKFRKPKYAIRDDEGYFWRWMDPVRFDSCFEPLTAASIKEAKHG